MNNRDFVDDDLAPTRPAPRRPAPGSVAASALNPPASAEPAGEDAEDGRLDVSALVRHRKQLDERSALTAEELEKLRRKEEDLQRRKRELEDARRKHDDYIKGKEEMLARISQSLVAIERHEIRAEQSVQLLSSTRLRFRELLESLREIRDGAWPENEMNERLTEALATIEDARMEYNKATARVEADLSSGDGEGKAGSGRPALFDDADLSDHPPDRTFWEWMGVGFAVSLPLILVLGTLGLLFVLHLMGLI